MFEPTTIVPYVPPMHTRLPMSHAFTLSFSFSTLCAPPVLLMHCFAGPARPVADSRRRRLRLHQAPSRGPCNPQTMVLARPVDRDARKQPLEPAMRSARSACVARFWDEACSPCTPGIPDLTAPGPSWKGCGRIWLRQGSGSRQGEHWAGSVTRWVGSVPSGTGDASECRCAWLQRSGHRCWHLAGLDSPGAPGALPAVCGGPAGPIVRMQLRGRPAGAQAGTAPARRCR